MAAPVSTTWYIPSRPLKLVFELTLFLLILVPGILLAGLKKILPAKKKSVQGQVILITGAAQGIGRKMALIFGKLGAKLACIDINETGCEETVRLIEKNGGLAVSYKCDVSRRDQIKDVHRRIRDEIGAVDILINNAGLVLPDSFSYPENDQFITDMINVNLMGQIWMIREILPLMLERNSGHIVAMSSMSSTSGKPGLCTYSITKWATNGMMMNLHNELNELNSNVKTTNVLPYYVNTIPTLSGFVGYDFRIPPLPVPVACRMIINGILEEKNEFSVPNYILIPILLCRLLPHSLQVLFDKIFHVKVLNPPKAKLAKQ